MKTNKKPTVGVVIITHNAKKHLPLCLPPWLQSPLNPKVLVVNSSSSDGTIELASDMGAEVLVIPRDEFNHGNTREKARVHLLTDIIVMTTPDAYAIDKNVLEKLIEPIIEGRASVSYARQIPHDGANFFASFHREFNYPKKSHIRSIDDVSKYGIYTFFCSDSCAAYSNCALDEIGGFDSVLIGEDTVAVAKLIQKGHKVAYNADSIVKHSHQYTLWQEFKRHFDTGLARIDLRELIIKGGSDSARGKEYVKEILKKLKSEKPHLLPYVILQTLIKWFGYKIGSVSKNAPTWFKRALSDQDYFWK